MKILIKNGYCLCEEDGFFDLLVKDDAIEKIDKKLTDKADKIIDAKDCIVMPTFCNAHTHLAMNLFRGMADDLSLMDWLNNHIFPSEAKFVNRDMVYKCSKLSMLEMIRGGSGCFMDMYFYEEEVARAALEIGLKGIIGEGIVDFESPSCKNAKESILKTKSLQKEFESENIKVSFAPHSTYTLSMDSLSEIADAAENAIIHIHVNETKSEVDMVKNQKNLRPIEVLDSLNMLNKNTYLAHCVASSEEDMDLIKQSSSNVINVPQSNLKLASGIAPIYKMIDKGIDIFIGTDGSASNNNLDMFEEIRTMSLTQKVFEMNEKALNAKDSFAVGVNTPFNKTGKIKEGYKADIAILKLDSIESVPLYNAYSYIIYAANSKSVDTVLINGKIIMERKEFIDIDEDKAKFEVKELAKKLGSIF